MADNLKKPLQSCGPEVRMARFRFTPAASPALQVLSEGKGVASVTRTGAGAWTVQLNDTKVKDLECFVGCIENDTTVRHQVRVESQSATNGTVAVSHKISTFATESSAVVVVARIPDISTADEAYTVAPIAGTVSKVYGVLGAAISGADAAITTEINGTPITGGNFTVANAGSAEGDVDSGTPSAANTVAAGDKLSAVTDGASTDTATEDVYFVIQGTGSTPAGSDTVDQIYGVVFYRVYD